MPDTFAFVDTSIFCHFRGFDELPWPALLKAESVILVVAPVTLSELNDHKDGNDTRLRQRAASVLKKLEGLSSQGSPAQVRPGVGLLLQAVEPTIDYPAHQLDHRCKDDRLLASVLQFRNSHPGAPLMVVADDFGLRLKATHHGIQASSLPQECKLSDPPDSNEKKIRELERELLELKNLMPRLAIVFPDGRNHHEVVLDPPLTVAPEEIIRQKNEIRQKHKMLDPSSATGGDDRSIQAFMQAFLQPSPEAIGRYNSELSRFYFLYDAWLDEKVTAENWRRRLITLDFALLNTGTSPAEDIDVLLHFPDGFELFDKSHLPRMLREPKPPVKPIGGFQTFDPNPFLGITDFGLSTWIPEFGPRNASRPEIRRTNSYEVQFNVQQLKHNRAENLDTLYAVFDSYEGAGSFGIDYTTMAANLPKPTTGKLHVIIQKA